MNLQHIQPASASRRSPSSLRSLLLYAWKMCRLSGVKTMQKSLNLAWKRNVGCDGGNLGEGREKQGHPRAPVSSFGTSRVPAIANGNWWFWRCWGSCNSNLRSSVSRCPAVGPPHAAKWGVSRCTWGGIIGKRRHASISCDTKMKETGWTARMTLFFWWHEHQDYMTLSEKSKYTDLVGQLYLNSDWVESFPSEPGLVYPDEREHSCWNNSNSFKWSIIPYFFKIWNISLTLKKYLLPLHTSLHLWKTNIS